MGLFTSKNLDSFENIVPRSDRGPIRRRTTADASIAKDGGRRSRGDAQGGVSPACTRDAKITSPGSKKIFQLLGRQPQRHTCAAMKGLIEEGQEVISASGDEKRDRRGADCGGTADGAL